jgi:hypothetical protein
MALMHLAYIVKHVEWQFDSKNIYCGLRVSRHVTLTA